VTAPQETKLFMGLSATTPTKIVPFPLVRRQSLIGRTARIMAMRGHELGARDPIATGEKVLAATVKRQRDRLEKRGINAATIDAELSGLECAIRCEHARLIAEGVCV
jgi:hypothetical protein